HGWRSARQGLEDRVRTAFSMSRKAEQVCGSVPRRQPVVIHFAQKVHVRQPEVRKQRAQLLLEAVLRIYAADDVEFERVPSLDRGEGLDDIVMALVFGEAAGGDQNPVVLREAEPRSTIGLIH